MASSKNVAKCLKCGSAEKGQLVPGEYYIFYGGSIIKSANYNHTRDTGSSLYMLYINIKQNVITSHMPDGPALSLPYTVFVTVYIDYTELYEHLTFAFSNELLIMSVEDYW